MERIALVTGSISGIRLATAKELVMTGNILDFYSLYNIK